MIKFKIFLALLLAFWSVFNYAQLPKPAYVGSAKYSALGSGATGIPTINFPIPNGTTNKDRIMVITFAGERDNPGNGNNFFADRVANPDSFNWDASYNWDVLVNGTLANLWNGYHINIITSTSTPTLLQNWNALTYTYKMPDNMTGSVPITFDKIALPQTSNDEISCIISVYENVKTFNYVFSPFSYGVSKTIAAPAVPVGRTASEIMYMVNGGITQQTDLSFSAGWTTDQVNRIDNLGTSTPSVWGNEQDGIAHIVGHQNGFAGNPSVTVSKTGAATAFANNFVFHTLTPFASPSVSGQVVTPTLSSATGTQGGGLWMNVVDKSNNNVVSVLAIDALGNFTIPAGTLLEAKNYDFILSKNAGSVNTTNPITVALNAGWVTVAEGLNSTTPDGTSNSIFNYTLGSTNVSGLRFAIRPVDPCSALESGNLDSDGDGISDTCDLDDDNDGILDTAEGQCSSLSKTAAWTISGTQATGTAGTVGVTFNSVETSGGNTNITYIQPGAFNTTNFWYSAGIAGSSSLQFNHTWDTAPEATSVSAATDGGTRQVTISFATPINKLLLNVDRLGGSGIDATATNYYSNSAEFTLTTANTSMSKLAGNAQLTVSGNKFYREPDIYVGTTNPGTEANNTTGPAAGTIQIVKNDGSSFTSITFTVAGIGPEGNGTDGIEMIFETCTDKDTDGDSIPDYLDLDSDGDGCSDAIEGGAAFTSGDLQTSSMPGGNSGATYNGFPTPVTQNLGNTVGNTATTMGVPTIAGTGQTVNNANNSFVNDCITTSCPPDPYTAQQTWWLPNFNTVGRIDFQTGSPVLNNPATGFLGQGFSSGTGLTIEGGSAAVTHPITGELLFVTDGNRVFKGSTGAVASGLVGGNGSAEEPVAVIPDPQGVLGRDFIIFGNATINIAGRLNSAKYNLETNVVSGVANLLPPSTIFEGLEVIPHTNGTDYWILVNHADHTVKSYLYSKASGFNATPVSSTSVPSMVGITPPAPDSFISWDPRTSNKVLIARHNKVGLSNFNPSTGELGTWQVYVTTAVYNTGYSAALSPNGRYIYYSDYTSTGNLSTLKYYDITTGVTTTLDNVNGPAVGMKIAPDGKLYRSGYVSGVRSLSYINADANTPPTAPGSQLVFNTAGFELAAQLPNNTYWACITCQSGTVAPALASTNITSNSATVGGLIALLSASNMPAGVAITIHSGATATDANKLANSTAIVPGTTYYASFFDGLAVCYSPTTAVTVSSDCYKPGVLDVGTYPTKHGITALGRAGADNGNWPMVRQSAWTALEAKTKGFVVNRVRFNASNQPVAADGATLVITSPVEGMMVYDTTNNCLKVYTSNNGGSTFAWHCMSTQACPQ